MTVYISTFKRAGQVTGRYITSSNTKARALASALLVGETVKITKAEIGIDLGFAIDKLSAIRDAE